MLLGQQMAGLHYLCLSPTKDSRNLPGPFDCLVDPVLALALALVELVLRSSNSASDPRDSVPSEHAGGLRQSFGLPLTGNIPTIVRLWKQWRIGSFKYSIINKVIE